RTPKKFQPIAPKSKITKLKTVARTGRRMLMEDKLILSLNFDMPYQFSFSPSFLHEFALARWLPKYLLSLNQKGFEFYPHCECRFLHLYFLLFHLSLQKLYFLPYPE